MRSLWSLAFVPPCVALLLFGCSAAGGGPLPDGQTDPPEATPAPTQGCGNGDCSACTSCLSACACATNGDPSCVSACSGGGGTTPPAGAGGSGTEPPGAGGAPGVGGAGGAPPAGAGGSGPPGGAGGAGSVGGSGSVGGAGGSAPVGCGDGYCDPFAFETCLSCALDCTCGTGGSGGVAGAGGAAGSGAGGGATGNPEHDAALTRARAGVGFSYWWGHGRYLPEGPNASNAGSCSGGCPSCTHTGSYGGDCSGFVAKVWRVPESNTDLSQDSHPYSTADFVVDSSRWKTVPQGSMQAADAMVYRSNGAGHIFIYESGDPWGSMYAYECKGCSYGCTGGLRTASSAYHAIRREGY